MRAWLDSVRSVVLVAAARARRRRGLQAGHDASATADIPAARRVKDDSEGSCSRGSTTRGTSTSRRASPTCRMMGRDAVRVVDPNKDEGTHADRVFVADLRAVRGPTAPTPSAAMTRADFEALAVARREKNGPYTRERRAAVSPSAPRHARAPRQPTRRGPRRVARSSSTAPSGAARATRPPVPQAARASPSSRRTSRRIRAPRARCSKSSRRTGCRRGPSRSSTCAAR